MNEKCESAQPIDKQDQSLADLPCDPQIACQGETARLFALAQMEQRSVAGWSEIATARLQGLLLEARQDIGDVFAVDEISILQRVFAGHCFSFQEIRELGVTICDALGFDFDRHEEFTIGPLIRKLLPLSTLDRLALADAIEQGWRGTGSAADTGLAAFAALGIQLVGGADEDYD